MIWNFLKLTVETIQFLIQENHTLPQTKAVFEALADSIVPQGHDRIEGQAAIDTIGTLDLHPDQYQVYILNHYLSLKLILIHVHFGLANVTAKMLNEAARQLISAGRNENPVNPAIAAEKGIFAALHATDRCRAITLLEQLQADLANLPVPFRNNPGSVRAMISVITMLATNGYYSEWPGYGSTRLQSPEKRKIEQFPAGWKQVGYPGPSKGHHAFRGYLVDNFTE